MSSSTISERLQAFFNGKRLSMAQVSRDTSIQYDTLQQILYGRVKAMGVDKFAAIWKAYPDIDAWYVLTGEPLRSDRQTANLSTADELRAFKAEIDRSLDQRIAELEAQTNG